MVGGRWQKTQAVTRRQTWQTRKLWPHLWLAVAVVGAGRGHSRGYKTHEGLEGTT